MSAFILDIVFFAGIFFIEKKSVYLQSSSEQDYLK